MTFGINVDYKCLMWNINGVNVPQKRRKLFHHFKKLKRDIVHLQETHIRKKRIPVVLDL